MNNTIFQDMTLGEPIFRRRSLNGSLKRLKLQTNSQGITPQKTKILTYPSISQVTYVPCLQFGKESNYSIKTTTRPNM